jgi:DNA-binding NarL/FixJ family response regulator
MSVRVALVDDHQPFRERLRALLQRDGELEIVAEASSGHELLEIALTTEMHVVCMDIRLPGMSGIETTRRLLAIRPGVRVIGLSAYAEPHYVKAMMDAGAVGHFTKGDVGDRLLEAIHRATVVRPRFGALVVAPVVANGASAPAPDQTQANADATSLGPRERDVLRLIAKGLASPEIATSLAIDPTMVDVYRRNIMRKLNLPTDDALTDYAREWSLGRDSANKAT